MKVFLLLAFVAVVFGKHHHGGHGDEDHKRGHKHPKHDHHGMMMKTVKTFEACAEGAAGDEDVLGACVTTHLTKMRECAEGLDTKYKMGLPAPVQIFMDCFKTLIGCMADTKSQECPKDMIKCVIGENGKKGAVMKRAPPPIKNSIKQYGKCKKAGESEDMDCTVKYVAEVANILKWAHLKRCQTGQFLCEALDGDNCLDTLTGAENKCVKDEPVVPSPPPKPKAFAFKKKAKNGKKKKMAKKFNEMAEALSCLKTAETEQDNTKYVECVYSSGWIKEEDHHLHCYSKLKSCDADTEATKSSCTEDYAECRGDDH